MKPTFKKIALSIVLLQLSAFTVAGEESPFQGQWVHCDNYKGVPVCDKYTLLQQGKNVCGTWEYFATGGYEGQLQATTQRRLTAKNDLICGTPGSETQTRCKNKHTPDGGWERPARDQYLMICKGRLVQSDEPTTKTCDSGLTRHPITPGELAKLRAEPWMKACLARP